MNITQEHAESTPLSCLKDLQETDLTVVVGLDGCLVASDTLWESLLVYLRGNPFNIVRALLWLFQGKTAFKANLASHVTLAVTGLPYQREVTSLLESLKREPRTILLATGAFPYIGNSSAGLPLWPASEMAILVDAP